MKTYKYIGDGAGVPGLAHEITEVEAAQLSTELAQMLKDAIASGVYIETPDAGRVDAEGVVSRPRKSKTGSPPEGD